MISIILNVIIAVCSVTAWLSIVYGAGDDRALAQRGIGSLKYHTVLSNLFSAAVSTLYVIEVLVGGGAALPAWLLVLKLTAAAVVMLTLLVTALLLTPTIGWRPLYQGGNFWLHLVCPILAMVDTVLFCPVETLPPWSTAFAMLPTALYAAGYLRAILIHGAEEDGQVYDFYGFLRWGEDKIGYVAIVMVLVTWGNALAMCFAR